MPNFTLYENIDRFVQHMLFEYQGVNPKYVDKVYLDDSRQEDERLKEITEELINPSTQLVIILNIPEKELPKALLSTPTRTVEHLKKATENLMSAARRGLFSDIEISELSAGISAYIRKRERRLAVKPTLAIVKDVSSELENK